MALRHVPPSFAPRLTRTIWTPYDCRLCSLWNQPLVQVTP
jgi:hypothetical protein